MGSSVGKKHPRLQFKLPEHQKALSGSPTFISWQTWSKLPLLYTETRQKQKKVKLTTSSWMGAVVLQFLTTQIKQKGQIKALQDIKLSHSPIWPRANEAVMSSWHAQPVASHIIEHRRHLAQVSSLASSLAPRPCIQASLEPYPKVKQKLKLLLDTQSSL